MGLSKNEIEVIVDNAIEDITLEVFKNEFSSFKEVEYAVDYLKEKINNIEADDFEDSVS